MYIPKHFENKNLDELHSFIEQFNFATLVSTKDNEITVSYAPVMLDRNSGSYGALSWHLAKRNTHINALATHPNVLCVFHGPHAYISHPLGTTPQCTRMVFLKS